MHARDLLQLQYVVRYTPDPQAYLDRHHDQEDTSQHPRCLQNELHN
jgi:hypothetical protein